MKMTLLMMILMLCLTCFAPANFGLYAEENPNGIPLVINEFMASNNSSVPDPQGQYDDWIELYNQGPFAIDIGGMYMTDDVSAPTKWRIPPDTIIDPGAYILIWADNDITDTGLHANFKLASSGEEITLFDRDGITLIDSVTFPNQTTDISYGRFPDSAEDWRFYSTPTPGIENGDPYLAEVEALKFSHHSEFHDQPFFVTITTETEDSTIYYTQNGLNPLELAARGIPIGKAYTGPILVSFSCERP